MGMHWVSTFKWHRPQGTEAVSDAESSLVFLKTNFLTDIRFLLEIAEFQPSLRRYLGAEKWSKFQGEFQEQRFSNRKSEKPKTNDAVTWLMNYQHKQKTKKNTNDTAYVRHCHFEFSIFISFSKSESDSADIGHRYSKYPLDALLKGLTKDDAWIQLAIIHSDTLTSSIFSCQYMELLISESRHHPTFPTA